MANVKCVNTGRPLLKRIITITASNPIVIQRQFAYTVQRFQPTIYRNKHPQYDSTKLLREHSKTMNGIFRLHDYQDMMHVVDHSMCPMDHTMHQLSAFPHATSYEYDETPLLQMKSVW
eukprot:CAMPEP_0197022208 /NCGR_PEP_ID=MMETSP1384-20130603/3114_1 /TAXON_ID=29189 /ORGANISM="Ammonia sp." /LENGTH=117 /DNA_ID=CAMNT_0042450203 /DNA_START=22 /DNA_END=372 /DNA_ORIENTATION=+